MDAREAVLANYSAPKHAVQIQRQALGGEPQNRAQQGCELVAQGRHGFRRWVLLGGMPQHRIVPAVFAEACRDLVHIQNHHPWGPLGGLPKRQVDGAQQAAAPSRKSRAQMTQSVERRRLIVELNDGGVQALSRFPPQRFEPEHVLANNAAGRVFLVAQAERTPIRGDYDHIGLEAGQTRIGMANLLFVLVEGANVNLRVDPGAEALRL